MFVCITLNSNRTCFSRLLWRWSERPRDGSWSALILDFWSWFEKISPNFSTPKTRFAANIPTIPSIGPCLTWLYRLFTRHSSPAHPVAGLTGGGRRGVTTSASKSLRIQRESAEVPEIHGGRLGRPVFFSHFLLMVFRAPSWTHLFWW